MKANEIMAIVLVVLGLLIILIKVMADMGWIKLPEKPKKKKSSVWEKFLEIVLELIKKDQTVYAIGLLLILFGAVFWFGPGAFVGSGTEDTGATPTATP